MEAKILHVVAADFYL